jgi:DNA primase
MISAATIQKINDEARVEEVVGEFVALKKRGANMIGLCPFHNEKTPSFYVSPAKGIYKCFGCGKAGGPVNFLMESQQMTYVETLRYLAAKYNIAIEETEQNPQAKEEAGIRESIIVATQFAQKYYSRNLMESEEGRSIGLAYFRERGFSDKTVEKFQLGFALNQRDAFTKEALQKGFTLDVLKKASLTSRTEGSSNDFFFDRVMFPIHDISGKVIGFGGRTLKKEKTIPKYINTAESEAYDKSRVLYGIFYAKSEIRKLDECLMCEGYTDVISLHQAGIENVVASSGTSLTVEQIKLVKRFSENLCILYDGDAAGVKAALRGLDLAIEGGLNVKLVLLPDGEDPDSYVQKVGETKFREFIQENKKDFILFKVSLFFEEAKKDPIKRAELTKDMVATIAKIADPFKRVEYVRECSRIMDVREQMLITEVNKLIRKQRGDRGADDKPTDVQYTETAEPVQPEDEFKEAASHIDNSEKDIIRLLIEYGTLPYTEDKNVGQYISEQLQPELFENEDYKTFFNYASQKYMSGEMLSEEQLRTHEENAMQQMTINILFFPYEISPNWEVKHKIALPNKSLLYFKDIFSSITMFKLKKTRKMLKDLALSFKEEADQEKLTDRIMMFRILKEEERELSKALGIVIHR